MADKTPLVVLPLPDTKGGGTPHVALIILHDIGDHLTFQRLTVFEKVNLLVRLMITIESFIGTYDDVAIDHLAERGDHSSL